MHEPITKDNFFAAVTAFHQARGGGKDGYPIIAVKDQPDQWVAWMAYFDHIDLGWSYTEMRRLWNKGSGTWTVPALEPWEFDHSFGMSTADYRRYAAKDVLGSEQTVADRKRFVDDLLKRTGAPHPTPGQESTGEDGERKAG